jgi:hypothetical protein
MGKIVIKEKKEKYRKIVIYGILMFLASVSLVWIGTTGSGILYTIVGSMGTLFFGICLFQILKRLACPKPLLIIDDNGIEDSSSSIALGFIPYEEIERFEIVRVGVSNPFIGVQLKNEEESIKKLSKMKQKVVKANHKIGYPSFSIRVDTAENMSIDEIFQLLKTKLQNVN